MATVTSDVEARTENRKIQAPLATGITIEFGDEGRGVISARDGSRLFLESPVYTGWIEEAELLNLLEPNDD